MKFRSETGLFFVGAGTSAGSSPLGKEFWRASPLDFIRNVSAISAVPASQGPLTQRLIKCSAFELIDIYPDRELRGNADEYLIQDILRRLPDGFAREHLKHRLASSIYLARTEGIVTDSYRAFRSFCPSIIANYNHDGLAREFCGAQHAIVEMHGTINPVYGAPEVGALISGLREFDITLTSDDLIMGLPESWTDIRLNQRLALVMNHSPRHVAIIGYSFAQMDKSYDDAVTLASFVQRFKHYPGVVFVVSPDPSELCEMLSDALEIRTVYPITRYWNVLAHAYLETLRNPNNFRSLNHAYSFLYDQYGSSQVFPITPPIST